MTRVERIGDTMAREANDWSPSVQRFLAFLADNGFDRAPRPLGIDGAVELVGYIEGDVGHYPLTEQVRSDAALRSAARTLRDLHRAAAGFEVRPDDCWMLPTREPAETVCHGDFAPYNCVFDGDTVVGVIDFDTAHPAPHAWDIAYALYRFAPLVSPSNAEGFGSLEEQCRRARAFCDEYGMALSERVQLPGLVAARLEAMVADMTERARLGDVTFAQNIADGHADLYLADISHLRDHAHLIRDALTRPPL